VAKRINYLNNKDMLAEIHKSKNSYCYYKKPEYANYDIILNDVAKINRLSISQARKNRAERMLHAKVDELGLKRSQYDEHRVDHLTIPATDLIFRIMTYDHIPEEHGRKLNPKTVADTKVKLNFPPFKHYKLDKNNKPYEIGRSHHAGHNQFSLDHGKITPKLANMFIKLCQRYGTRSNWRGYTYNDEMQGQALLQLSQIGLQFDESKSQNPFAYYTATITNSFTRVLNMEKKNQNLRDDLLEQAGAMPSLTRQMKNSEELANIEKSQKEEKTTK
jgi:hypothetical protein